MKLFTGIWLRGFLLCLAVALLPGQSVQAKSIGIDFGDSQTTLMGADETAGTPEYEQANWNSRLQAGTGTVEGLVDNTGQATTASVSWTCQATWRTGVTDVPGDMRLMKGYLDTGNSTTTTVTVSGIPYSRYDLVIYMDGSNDSDWRVGRYTVVDPANGSVLAGPIFNRDAANSDFSGVYVQTPVTSTENLGANTPAGNYIIIPNLTVASFRLEATPASAGSNTLRAPVNAIQIASREAPRLIAPANGAVAVPPDQVFAWEAPQAYNAVGYNVYMDPNMAMLDTAVVASNYADTTLSDVALDYETTYLWRVDAIDPNDGSPILHRGFVWSFTTDAHPSQKDRVGGNVEDLSLSLANASFEDITATSSDGAAWGYDVNDWYEGFSSGSNQCFWELGSGIGLTGDLARWAGLETGGSFYQAVGTVTPGAEYEVRMLIGNRGDSFGTGSAALFAGGTSSNAANGVLVESFAVQLDMATFTMADGISVENNVREVGVFLSVPADAPAGQILWLRIKSESGKNYYDNIRFFKPIDTRAAWGPSPAVGASDVGVREGTLLSWQAGVDRNNNYQTVPGIIGYNVYAGTDKDNLAYLGVASTTEFLANNLPSDSTIYWRVDTRLGAEVLTGRLWRFDTEALLAVITEQPVSAVIEEGQEVRFSVAAESFSPASYTWYKVADAGDVAVGTGPLLVIASATLAAGDEGGYYCKVSNAAGDVSSDLAYVTIKRKMGHWTFDGTLASAVNPAHVGSSTVSRYVQGISGQAWQFTAEQTDPNVIIVADTANDFNFYPQGYTVSAWINTTQSGWGALVAKQYRPAGSGNNVWRGFIVAHQGANAGSMLRGLFGGDIMSADVTVNDGQWHHVTATYDALTGLGRIYVDGRLNNTSAVDMTRAQTNDQPLVFGAETEAGQISPYVGLLDDVQIWNYALDAYEVAAVYTAIRPDDAFCVEFDAMDFDQNCFVDLADFAAFAASWLDCNWAPADLCQ